MSGDWRHDAKCRDEDPELFFANDATIDSRRTQRRAKDACAACPSAAPCLLWAMDHPGVEGIWGGLDETERLWLRRVDAA